jgi:DNA (cytosine-5)-methyltransferase 1
MRGADAAAYESDGRHFLYREYLRLLRKFKPPVFVMENVKGLLSSTVDGRRTFTELVRDLKAAGYSLHSFVRTGNGSNDPSPEDYVIRCEDYGIPQSRHRVIILGLRNGLERGRKILQPGPGPVAIEEAIGDLPAIRSGLSDASPDEGEWRSTVESTSGLRVSRPVRAVMREQLRKRAPESMGGDFLPELPELGHASAWLKANSRWFCDRHIGGVTQHAARTHMRSDIQRYFFAACYAKVHGHSPNLADFPRRLWPAHQNARAAADGEMFSDRFRVQAEGRPATTVVSHISKDGHYYIHYDPVQCRSLTVREAARLQTFPDNYFFEGPRTAQYHQVGNAVPPLLARQLAGVVADILSQL